MVLQTLVVVFLLGASSWGLYTLFERRARARAERLQRIRHDPVDHVEAEIALEGPATLGLQHGLEQARDAEAAAQGRVDRLRSSFEGGEPSHRQKLKIAVLCGIWLVAAFGTFWIDLPIILTVSGGNPFIGVLGTLITLTVPTAASLALAALWERRRQNPARQQSAAFAGVLTVFAAVVAVMALLAPLRAEILYADPIRTAQQQLAVYTVGGDKTAADFENIKLAELNSQKATSAEWNQMLVILAAGVEAATGFFVLPGLHLLQLRRARQGLAKARTASRAAEEAIPAHNAQQSRRLSADFRAAGLTQQDLRGAVFRTQRPPEGPQRRELPPPPPEGPPDNPPSPPDEPTVHDGGFDLS